jgi:hypothetical protein
MKYKYCPGSLWLRSLDPEHRSQTESETYLTPFVGRVIIHDFKWLGGGGSKRFPPQTEGFFSVESSLSHADMNSLWNSARVLDEGRRVAVQSWLEELWAFNQVPPQQGLPDFIDFQDNMEMFLGKPDNEQEAILDAIAALLDAEEDAIRMFRYTGKPPVAVLAILREDKKFLTRGSRAHVAAVTHREHKDAAREAARGIFEKMTEVVKEGEWEEESEGRIVAPDFGNIDPLTLNFIIGAAEEAEVVEDATAASQEYAGEKFQISSC